MIYIQDEVLEFIHRRFPIDSHFMDMNCYYFSLILHDRFKKGAVWYDVINGHYVYLYNGKYYDWTGIVEPNGYLVEWDKFKEYDEAQYKVIVRDCIK